MPRKLTSGTDGVPKCSIENTNGNSQGKRAESRFRGILRGAALSLRKQRGYSQQKWTDIVYVEQSTIRRIERGQLAPTPDLLISLRCALPLGRPATADTRA
jgi:DNA-binding XRE family transcriptional regulator